MTSQEFGCTGMPISESHSTAGSLGVPSLSQTISGRVPRVEQVEFDSAAIKQPQPGSMSLPMNEDRPIDGLPSRPPLELRDGMSTLDVDIGARLLEQSSGKRESGGHDHPCLGIRQVQPNLPVRTPTGENKIGRKERRRFFQPKTCRHQEIGKQRIANPIAISGAGRVLPSGKCALRPTSRNRR